MFSHCEHVVLHVNQSFNYATFAFPMQLHEFGEDIFACHPSASLFRRWVNLEFEDVALKAAALFGDVLKHLIVPGDDRYRCRSDTITDNLLNH